MKMCVDSFGEDPKTGVSTVNERLTEAQLHSCLMIDEFIRLNTNCVLLEIFQFTLGVGFHEDTQSLNK